MPEPYYGRIECEDEWLRGGNPETMEVFLRETGSPRRWQLFACLCCWRVMPLLDDRCRHAVAVAERLADGLANQAERLDAEQAAEVAVIDAWQVGVRAVVHATTAVAAALRFPRRAAARIVTAAANKSGERAAQCNLLRELFANPFRPFIFDPAWRTPLVTAIASHVYEREAFDELPVLADALDDAGCDVTHLLAHLREPATHHRGCWALDAALGKD